MDLTVIVLCFLNIKSEIIYAFCSVESQEIPCRNEGIYNQKIIDLMKQRLPRGTQKISPEKYSPFADIAPPHYHLFRPSAEITLMVSNRKELNDWMDDKKYKYDLYNSAFLRFFKGVQYFIKIKETLTICYRIQGN